mgnify:CR=1 FL=1
MDGVGGVNYYLQVLFSFVILGLLLYGFYRVMLIYKLKALKGNIALKERINLDNQTNIVLVKYKSSEFLIANNQKTLLLLKEYESEPDV